MNQNWTNAKTKHKAMNVCWCMDRLNMTSFWVPTMVLSSPTVLGRKKYVNFLFILFLFNFFIF